jgi:L-asparaginase II
MSAHPEMVGGPTRDVTRLMQQVPGMLAKDGAEGVQVAALPDGRTVAVKIADGAGRARTPVTVGALRALGVEIDPEAFFEPVLGHGEPVGRVVTLVGAP